MDRRPGDCNDIRTIKRVENAGQFSRVCGVQTLSLSISESDTFGDSFSPDKGSRSPPDGYEHHVLAARLTLPAENVRILAQSFRSFRTLVKIVCLSLQRDAFILRVA
jgi:hypothetical protein